MAEGISNNAPAALAAEWFPMRVTYHRELKVKEELDSLGVENFLPMHYELVGEGAERRKQLVPAIHNLLFIRTDMDTLTELKRSKQALEPLRYMTRPAADRQGMHEIIRVPDRQMENFMRVATVQDDRLVYLDPSAAYLRTPGQRVRIKDGDFKDAEGVIKRIKNNKRVVVEIQGIAAVAITFIPTIWLEPIL
jgi:transcription antitermination factor NusG